MPPVKPVSSKSYHDDVIHLLGPFTFEDTINGEPKFLGYRSINVTVDFGEEIKAEIQLHTKEPYDFKKNVSDPIYQK